MRETSLDQDSIAGFQLQKTVINCGVKPTRLRVGFTPLFLYKTIFLLLDISIE